MDILQKRYKILSPIRPTAMQLRVGMLKGINTKGINKHLLALNTLVANLEKERHSSSNEQSKLKVVNALPDHSY